MNINKVLLYSIVFGSGYTLKSLSEKIGICYSTFYRKVKNPRTFSIEEVQGIAQILNLSQEDIIKIFFTYLSA